MNFLTAMGLIFPPQAYAAWVGESNEDTKSDRERIEGDKGIQEIFIDLLQNAVNFARARQREYFAREPLRDVPWIMEKCAVVQRAAPKFRRFFR